MKNLYLVGAIIVFLLILVLNLPQVGITCNWMLIRSTTNPSLVLFQACGLGAILGGLSVLYWKALTEEKETGTDDKE